MCNHRWKLRELIEAFATRSKLFTELFLESIISVKIAVIINKKYNSIRIFITSHISQIKNHDAKSLYFLQIVQIHCYFVH